MGNELLLTLALSICGGAIFIFFSQEFLRIYKKILSIPGVKLLLPLILASWFIEVYEGWGRWLMIRCQSVLHQILYQLATMMPFETGAVSVIRILYLFILSGLPLWSYLLWCKYRGRAHPKPFDYHWGFILWVVAAILLTVA